MRAVNKIYLREVLKDERDLTLKYDGSTKSGHHLVEAQLSTDKDTFTLNVQETCGGTASDYSECIKDLVYDVDSNIMKNISNTMTDRCVTNNAIDKEIETLTGNKVNSFRCAMHPLDTIHKQTEKRIKQHELTMKKGNADKSMPYTHRGESSTQALLRAIDKVLHCSASGLPKELPQHLRNKGFLGGQNSSLYPRWVGNRFNLFL